MSRTHPYSTCLADANLDDDIDVFTSPSVPVDYMIQYDDFDPPDDDDCPPCLIQHANTRCLKQMLTGNMATNVCTVLDHMEDVGLNLLIFLDLLSWGDDSCITDAKI